MKQRYAPVIQHYEQEVQERKSQGKVRKYQQHAFTHGMELTKRIEIPNEWFTLLTWLLGNNPQEITFDQYIFC